MNDETPLFLRDIADGIKKVKVKRQKNEVVVESELNLDLVERMAAVGLTFKQIAAFFGMSELELKRRKKASERLDQAIEQGKAKGVAKVANTLFDLAITDKNIIATLFYLKTVGGWREADKIKPSDEDDPAHRVQVNLPHNFRD